MLSASVAHPHEFVKIGFFITPVAPDTKRPIYKDWPTRVVGPWQFPMDQRVGIVCRKLRGGKLFAVGDLDHKPDRGLIAAETYARFEALATTRSYWTKIAVMHSTGGIAYHVCFNPAYELSKGTLYHDDTKIGELLGKGSQVVAQPPSHYLHGSYETTETLTEDETATLLADLGFTERPSVEANATKPRPAGINRPGDDYNDRGDVIGLLQRHGWTCTGKTRDGKSYWKRPGKTEPGHSATWGHNAGQFYVFSADAAPFAPDASYSAFGMYALLEHKGNYAAAAADLARQGFGDRLSIKEHRTPKKLQRAWLADATVTKPVGRPMTDGPDRLLNILIDQGIEGHTTNSTNRDLATLLNVSIRTINRWLVTLKAQGSIALRDTPSGRWIDILNPDNKPPKPHTLSTIPPTEGEQHHVIFARDVAVMADKTLCETCGLGELAPDEDEIARCSYCECAAWASTLATEGCELYEAVRPKALRVALITDYVRSNGRPDLDDEPLAKIVTRSLAARREDRADARFTAKLKTLSDRALHSRETSMASKAKDANDAGNRGQAFVFSHMAWLIGLEQERREPLRRMLGKYDHRKRTLFEEVTT